ncbi:MAG: hypothetical protein ACYC1D_15125 [Acidimicrobiales bacterium]
MPDDCQSCGRADRDLTLVHRVYQRPEFVRVEEAEWWCSSCRTQYPHEVAPTG